MFKTVAVMLVAVAAGTIGDLLLASGMKELGDISSMNLKGMLRASLQALTSPKLVAGTAMLAVFFFLWLAFLSQYLLHEVVSPMRWAGTVLVAVGVIMITKSGA